MKDEYTTNKYMKIHAAFLTSRKIQIKSTANSFLYPKTKNNDSKNNKRW